MTHIMLVTADAATSQVRDLSGVVGQPTHQGTLSSAPAWPLGPQTTSAAQMTQKAFIENIYETVVEFHFKCYESYHTPPSMDIQGILRIPYHHHLSPLEGWPRQGLHQCLCYIKARSVISARNTVFRVRPPQRSWRDPVGEHQILKMRLWL